MAVTCPKCRVDNSDSQKFCGGCGTQLPAPGLDGAATAETLPAAAGELATGSTFAGRYQIIEELGKGGMGRVYKAFDTRVKEKIALKLIRADIASDPETIERFSNELKLARRIRHKNVCGMFDLGEAEGAHFITMEYVHGEDLKSMLRMTGMLGIGTVLSIGKQICDGLAEAHNAGVVHRDLKPQNIMVDKGGSAKIMDFGIARSLRGHRITRAGVIIGTPEYMSPEQVEGNEADQRADIYSLGVILYEMATGRVPFEGDTPFTVGVKIKSEIPKDPKEINAQIPPDLSRLILKCLEKDKQARYADVRELREELEKIERGVPTAARIIPPEKPATSREITVTFNLKRVLVPSVVVISLAVIGIMVWWLLLKNTPVPKAPEKPSLAVLPFQDWSPQKDQDWFCNGITEEIINRLSKISELKVTGRTSVFLLKDKQDIHEIGKALGVATVLEGSITKVESKLRARVQLINIADGETLWTENYDRDVKDVFAITDEIALAVADKLKLTLLGDEKTKLAKHQNIDPAAYEEYLKGLNYWWQWSEEGVTNALSHFRRAIEIAPDYAPAYAGMALAYITGGGWLNVWPPLEVVPKGMEAAQRAIQLDPLLVDGYVARGYARANFDWDWAGAEEDFKQAVELNPNSVLALDAYTCFLQIVGDRPEEGVRLINRALEIDPLSPGLHHDLGTTYYLYPPLDKVVPHYRRALELDRNYHSTRVLLALSYQLAGKPAEAAAEFQTLAQLAPDVPFVQGAIGYFYAVTGRAEDAKNVLAALDRIARIRYVPCWARALIYIGLGHKILAMDWLQKGIDEHDGNMWFLKRDPCFNSLRGEPRFQALLKKVGLHK
jgi:eukaryotic-like serine/threonine-protein kinase